MRHTLKIVPGVDWDQSRFITCTPKKRQAAIVAVMCTVRTRRALFFEKVIRFSPVGCSIVACRENQKPSFSDGAGGSPKVLSLPEEDLTRAIPEADAFAFCAHAVTGPCEIDLATYGADGHYLHWVKDAEDGTVWLIFLESEGTLWDRLIGVKLAEAKIVVAECGSRATLRYRPEPIDGEYKAELHIPAEYLLEMFAQESRPEFVAG